jgi:hypothetical protein
MRRFSRGEAETKPELGEGAPSTPLTLPSLPPLARVERKEFF